MRRAIVVLVVALAAVGGRADGQTVVVGVGGQLTGEQGGRIRVPVYADLRGAPGRKLGSYTLRLQWNPAVLEWVSMNVGAFGQVIENPDSAYYGVLRVGGLSAAGVDGLFDLFAANFDILASQSTTLTLTVAEVVAAGSFADLTPLTTAISGTYCPALGRWGDLDGDGQANSRDALAILSAIVGLTIDSTFTLSLGDVDGDAQVNSRDALITLSHAVGLAVPGQRVLVYAPGTCGTGGTTGITILPDTVDLAVGQEIRPILIGSAAGVPAGTSVNWTVANAEIAVVSAEGKLAGRSAGTTTLTAALGPGITASVPVIVRARRTVWHVDATRATLAAIQMGTVKYPFSTPQQAFPVVADGDTVRVWPGVHDYLGYEFCTGGGGGGGEGPPLGPIEQCTPDGYVTRDIVLLGDTLANGTRPVLRGNPDVYYAVYLDGARRFVMRNLVLRGFDQAVYQRQPTRLAEFENVLFELAQGNDGIALYYGADTVILRNVEFRGDSIAYSYPFEVEDGSSVVVFDRVRVDLTRGGLYVYDADSVDIRDSWIRTGYYEGLYISGSATGSRVYSARNYFDAESDNAFVAYDVHAVRSERNTFRVGYYGYQPFSVYGMEYPPRAGSSFVSRSDSVIASDSLYYYYYYYEAIYADDLDSIVVDSLRLALPDSAYGMSPGELYGNTIEVRNSRFTGISGYPLYLYGRRITVDNSEFTGCRSPCSMGSGVYGSDYVDSLALFQVTGSTFQRLNRGVEAYTYGNVHRVVATGNAMDSVGYNFLLNADSVLLTDNVLTRVTGYGVNAGPRYQRPTTAVDLRRNRITTSYTYAYPLNVQSAHVASTGNRYVGAYYGPYLYNYSGSAWQLAMTSDTIIADSALGGYNLYLYGGFTGSVRKSRIEGGGYGLYAPMNSGSLLTLDSNVVTGTRSYGAYLSVPAGASVTGTRNNISSNAAVGLYSSSAGTVAFTLGRFVGNGTWAVQAGSGSVDASQNWWGAASAPPTSGPNAVSGSVTTSNFLTSDPADVPPLGPPAVAFVADLWRTPIGSRRSGAQVTTAPSPPGGMVDDQAERAAERQARRARVETRAVELRQAMGQRKAQGEERRPN